MALEWEGILELEEYLKKTPKAERPEADSEEEGKAGGLVLFGAGRMFHNYMEVWGDAYPPSFIVDNNEMLWGGMRENVGIRLRLCFGRQRTSAICLNLQHVSCKH